MANRNLWTALILSVALLGQTAASALPATCAAESAPPVYTAATAPDTPAHHERMSASSQADDKECCAAGADTECGISGCVPSAILPSPSSVGLVRPQPPILVSHSAGPPPSPVFPLFRPPIA